MFYQGRLTGFYISIDTRRREDLGVAKRAKLVIKVKRLMSTRFHDVVQHDDVRVLMRCAEAAFLRRDEEDSEAA
jgi:hypothetical protein